MANSTNFVSFPFFRNYTGAGGVGEDALGFFHCKLATAKFLDIEQIAEKTAAAVIRTRKKSKSRDLTLIDGTVLKKSEGEDGTAKESDVLASSSRFGTNPVTLVTGKKTANGNFKRVTFLFPGFATNLNISDALGSLIPAGKVKVDPTAADVFNFFISKGGRRYPILTKAAAAEEKGAQVPENQSQLEALENEVKKKKVAPAKA